MTRPSHHIGLFVPALLFPLVSVWLAAGWPAGPVQAAPAAETPAESSESDASTVEELAMLISTLFPSVSGTVTAIDSDKLELDRGTAQGIRPGLTLSVYRTGEPFRHPLTGAPIAASETPLGAAIVDQSETDRASARLLESPPTPVQAGDRVRLSAARLPVAIASSSSPAVSTRFVIALEDTGRFRADPLATLKPAPSLIVDTSDEPVAPPPEPTAALAQEARAQGADYLFLFDVRVRKGAAIGAVTIIEARSGRIVDAVETPLLVRPEDFPREAADPVLDALAERDGRAFKEARFDYRAEHAVVGDLDQDGTDELIVSDGKRLRVYRMDGNADGLSTTLAVEEPADPPRRQLALDLADINGTGRPQLFVTAMSGDRLESYVLTWKDGALTRVAERQPYYFRVLQAQGRPPTLVGQRRTVNTPFSGAVVSLKWAGKGYGEETVLALPPSVAIYDFMMADLDKDGRDELVYLDARDYLVAAGPDGRRLGVSDESYGGVESFVEYVPVGITRGGDDPPERVRLPARLLIADLDGDGTLEVILPKNVPTTKRFERIKGYKYGQLYALGWDGSRFTQKWTIPKINGVIADIAMGRASGKAGEPRVLVLANSTFTDKTFKTLFSTSSQLLLYTVPKG